MNPRRYRSPEAARPGSQGGDGAVRSSPGCRNYTASHEGKRRVVKPDCTQREHRHERERGVVTGKIKQQRAQHGATNEANLNHAVVQSNNATGFVMFNPGYRGQYPDMANK